MSEVQNKFDCDEIVGLSLIKMITLEEVFTMNELTATSKGFDQIKNRGYSELNFPSVLHFPRQISH